MEFAFRLVALIRKDLPFQEYAGAFCGLAAVTEVEDSALLHLFRHGACYHRPVDLPDTTGLTWREGVYRCLGSVRARVGTSPSPVALPCPRAVSVASPPAGCMASPMRLSSALKCLRLSSALKCLRLSSALKCLCLSSALKCPLLASAPQSPLLSSTLWCPRLSSAP